MKAKFYLIAAAACAALAACSKNEVAPVDVDQEITYQTIETKAASGFKDANKFTSYAYFLPETATNWDSDATSSQTYIDGAEVSYNSANHYWKSTSAYYWPKKGKLTFFAWSTNSAATTMNGATVECSNATGITVDELNITTNKNVDFLVADIAKDQTANTSFHEDEGGNAWHNGVPTVFKHALSSIAFKAMTVSNGVAYDYKTNNDIEFYITSIDIKSDVNRKYTQGNTASNHTWKDVVGTSSSTLDVLTPAANIEVTKDAPTSTYAPVDDDYKIVMPQTFATADGNTITVNYDIVYFATVGTPVTEHISKTVDLFDAFGATGWEPTKKYILTIKLGLDEILWDPDVTDWALVETPTITL